MSRRGGRGRQIGEVGSTEGTTLGLGSPDAVRIISRVGMAAIDRAADPPLGVVPFGRESPPAGEGGQGKPVGSLVGVPSKDVKVVALW